jgi:hypothetical protein
MLANNALIKSRESYVDSRLDVAVFGSWVSRVNKRAAASVDTVA